MLAFLGAVVQEAYTFPWYQNTPKLFTEGHEYGSHNGSLFQILLWTSFFEIMTLPAVIQMIKGQSDRQPGNFGLDIFGMAAKDPMMAQKEIKVSTYFLRLPSFAITSRDDSNMFLPFCRDRTGDWLFSPSAVC